MRRQSLVAQAIGFRRALLARQVPLLEQEPDHRAEDEEKGRRPGESGNPLDHRFRALGGEPDASRRRCRCRLFSLGRKRCNSYFHGRGSRRASQFFRHPVLSRQTLDDLRRSVRQYPLLAPRTGFFDSNWPPAGPVIRYLTNDIHVWFIGIRSYRTLSREKPGKLRRGRPRSSGAAFLPSPSDPVRTPAKAARPGPAREPRRSTC